VDAPTTGTLSSYATRPGSVAADGTSRNGIYTRNLLLAMDVPDQPVELMPKGLVGAVKRDSNGRQEPWSEGSIEGYFYFTRSNVNPSNGLPAPQVTAGQAPIDPGKSADFKVTTLAVRRTETSTRESSCARFSGMK
jgi:hypothetical protein